MSKVLVAIDIDGTLRNNTVDQSAHPQANEDMRNFLIILKRNFKNTKIMVWSGGGELYARQCAAAFGIQQYVDVYADKQVIGCIEANCPDLGGKHWHFGYNGRQPDIAIDDMHSFSLGKINLICKVK